MFKAPWAFVLSLLLSPMAAAAEDAGTEFKGYYKNLLLSSRTVFPIEEGYSLDLNRLRMEWRGRPRAWLGYEVQYDNEVLLGSFLDTAQFALLKTARPATYWDLEDDYIDRGSLFVRHRLHRGFVNVTTAAVDITLGRQRIAWGSGRLWNPTDLFNPYNPTQLEREERTGVDAILIEKDFGALSRLSLAYAPQRGASVSRALRYRMNVANTDVALLAGAFCGVDVVGAELAGRVGDAGWYGEAAHSRPEQADRFTRTVLGAEYAFANTLTVGAEYYRNGEGFIDRTRYDFARLFRGQIQNVARHYVGAHLRYDITPLLRTENYLILNRDDGSRFFAPSLVYSLAANLDVSVGIQFFRGASESEYATFHDLYYMHVHAFF